MSKYASSADAAERKEPTPTILPHPDDIIIDPDQRSEDHRPGASRRAGQVRKHDRICEALLDAERILDAAFDAPTEWRTAGSTGLSLAFFHFSCNARHPAERLQMPLASATFQNGAL